MQTKKINFEKSKFPDFLNISIEIRGDQVETVSYKNLTQAEVSLSKYVQ